MRELSYVGILDDEALVVKIYHGSEIDVSVDTYDYVGRRKLTSYGVRDEYVKDIETWIAEKLGYIL